MDLCDVCDVLDLCDVLRVMELCHVYAALHVMVSWICVCYILPLRFSFSNDIQYRNNAPEEIIYETNFQMFCIILLQYKHPFFECKCVMLREVASFNCLFFYNCDLYSPKIDTLKTILG